MIEKDKNKRPYAMQAYEELCFIEEYINNPNNEQNKKSFKWGICIFRER